MADLEILTVDNPQHLKILRSKSRKVQKVTPKLAAFAQRMLETMRQANGAGLAAPQVGVLQRIFVVELPEDEENDQPRETYILFNPEIVKAQGEQIGYEGCLSIPGYIGEVARDEQVTVKGLNEKGRAVRYKVEGYLARAFQRQFFGDLFLNFFHDPALDYFFGFLITGKTIVGNTYCQVIVMKS